MKKLFFTIALLLASFTSYAGGSYLPAPECGGFQIIVYAKVNNTLNSTLLEYCFRDEAQDKLAYLQAHPTFGLGKQQIKLIAVPLFFN